MLEGKYKWKATHQGKQATFGTSHGPEKSQKKDRPGPIATPDMGKGKREGWEKKKRPADTFQMGMRELPDRKIKAGVQ